MKSNLTQSSICLSLVLLIITACGPDVEESPERSRLAAQPAAPCLYMTPGSNTAGKIKLMNILAALASVKGTDQDACDKVVAYINQDDLYLDISHQDLKDSELSEGLSALNPMIQKTDHIIGINASHNQLTTTSPLSIKGTRKIKYLDLSHNQYDQSMTNFLNRHYRPLQVLNLSHNRFHGVVSQTKLRYLEDIRYLDLSHNQITELTFDYQVATLRYLDVSQDVSYKLAIEKTKTFIDLAYLGARGADVQHIDNLPKRTGHMGSVDLRRATEPGLTFSTDFALISAGTDLDTQANISTTTDPNAFVVGGCRVYDFLFQVRGRMVDSAMWPWYQERLNQFEPQCIHPGA